MKIEKYALGSLGTNCYLVENEETKELVIIDPAICPDYMISYVKRSGNIERSGIKSFQHVWDKLCL